VGWQPEPAKESNLVLFKGDLLTPDEIEAIKGVYGRPIPMSELPMSTADVPRLRYRPHVYSEGRPRSTHHYGQRKLLNSEVVFLLDNARDGDTVVYAGSAPGIHLPFLMALFAHLNLRYVLIDPRKFAIAASDPASGPIIIIRQGFFTDEIAGEFADRDDVLFISDIRRGTEETEVPTPETVEEDMAQQAEWVRIMQPRASLLKYRLNYSKEDKSEYLDGDVRIQIWPGDFHRDPARIARALPKRARRRAGP
jgi:hypothetical protein